MFAFTVLSWKFYWSYTYFPCPLIVRVQDKRKMWGLVWIVVWLWQIMTFWGKTALNHLKCRTDESMGRSSLMMCGELCPWAQQYVDSTHSRTFFYTHYVVCKQNFKKTIEMEFLAPDDDEYCIVYIWAPPLGCREREKKGRDSLSEGYCWSHRC